jgi:tRNA (adenine37-N6)-methyltransferase
VPRQPGLVPQTYSELTLLPEWQPEISLQGLEAYSHIWLIFLFHLNTNARFHAKVHPPRLRGGSIGLFATRSPHRPNPVGLSLVELCEVKKNGLLLSGADLVEGTPILDIKPYLPQHEALPLAQRGWTEAVAENKISVDWSEDARTQLQAWIERSGRSELVTVIENLIQQDPRPLVYKGYEAQESPYRQRHAIRLYDGDIHFEFLSANIALVIEIKF